MKKKTIVKEDLDEDKLRYIDLPETIAPKVCTPHTSSLTHF
jgi:hypothetical protein